MGESNTENAKLPSHPFNVQKLAQLIERRQQNFVLSRDLGDRVSEARNACNWIRNRVEDVRRRGGDPTHSMLQQLAAAEAKLKALAEEQQLLQAKMRPQNAIAEKCEEWARSQGWTEDGRPGGRGGWDVANGPGTE